jgi:hypothetical protein
MLKMLQQDGQHPDLQADLPDDIIEAYVDRRKQTDANYQWKGQASDLEDDCTAAKKTRW